MDVQYIQHMGSDRTVCNAARVSFDKDLLSASTELDDKDTSLINYLARGYSSEEHALLIQQIVTGVLSNKDADTLLNTQSRRATHWAPFAHCMITLRETMPIHMARQRTKHVIGMVYSEVSRRYVDGPPQFHLPTEIRSRPEKSIKQGSGGIHPDSDHWLGSIAESQMEAAYVYNTKINEGVAPEQARMELPQSMLTSFWVTGSLYAWANAYNQRSDPHAQLEIQALAKQWDSIIRPLFPVSWEALTA